MNPGTIALGPFSAGSANAIVTSNTPAGAGNLTIVGTTFAADAPRKVLVTFGTEGSARTIQITGTNVFGNVIAETLAVKSGAPGTVATEEDFATVTQVKVFAAWTSAMTVGTVATGSVVGSTPWIIAQRARIPFLVGYSVRQLSGTPSFQLELTMDDPNLAYESQGSIAIASSDQPQGNAPPITFIDPTPAGQNGFGGSAKTANFQGVLSLPCIAFRLSLGTADGSSASQFQYVPAGYFGA